MENMEIESVKRQELTEALRTKLIECGWRDELASMCRESIHRHGVENVRLEQIIHDVSSKAKETIPEQIKQDLLQRIRLAYEEQRYDQQQEQEQHQQPSTSNAPL